MATPEDDLQKLNRLLAEASNDSDLQLALDAITEYLTARKKQHAEERSDDGAGPPAPHVSHLRKPAA